MALAIKAENLSKAYQLGQIGTGTISRDIERWYAKIRGKDDPFLKIGELNDRTIKGKSDITWSLKDISFEIQQGDAVGIVGRNGAGKSTLLKLLSRVTAPTSGYARVKGRIASLLEVGTGFHPELTGRENIYLNGAILGMRKREISRKFHEIVDFAGVERYIDTPVKRYSSGMYVRLAFAVAAHLESEILIVDEVLAVGDAEFQKKCLGKMGEVRKGEGRTVLFVSHQMSSIQSLCNKGILLDQGQIKLAEDIDKVIRSYVADGRSIQNIKYYKKYLKYVKIEQKLDAIWIEAEYDTTIPIKIPHLGVVIYDTFNQPIFGTNPNDDLVDSGMTRFSEKGKITIQVKNPKLIDGDYSASVWFSVDGLTDVIVDFNCIVFSVAGMTNKKQKPANISGNVIPETYWNFM